jgi:hypothetical protein
MFGLRMKNIYSFILSTIIIIYFIFAFAITEDELVQSERAKRYYEEHKN